MYFGRIVLSLSLLSCIFGQNANDTGLDIAAIEAHFQQAGLIGSKSLLESFTPSSLLSASFSAVGSVSPGQALSRDQVSSAPTISITPANSSVSLTGVFTLVMVDADKVGTDDTTGVTRHWLVNNITVSGSTISNDSAVAVTNYAGPAPPPGSGAHRYVILLYVQPTDFHPPAEFSGTLGVSKMSLSEYVQDSGLGALIAGNYFTVEEGTATASVSSTSPVQSSTLSPVGSTSTSTSTGPLATNTNASAKLQTAYSFMTVMLGVIGVALG